MLTDYVKNWFMRADEDLALIEVTLKEETVSPNSICFHAQQAGEKYLKGFLVLHKNSFPKIHDLVKLLKLCSEIEADFLDYVDEVNYLSQFYLITRYPLTEYPPAGKKEAKKAITFAEEVINFVKKKNYVHF